MLMLMWSVAHIDAVWISNTRARYFLIRIHFGGERSDDDKEECWKHMIGQVCWARFGKGFSDVSKHRHK